MSAATAIRLAAKSRQRLLGFSIRYSRGSLSVCLKAVPGKTNRDLINGDQYTKVESRALLILACDLKLGGSLIKPEDQDLITATIAGVAHTFEVTPLVSGAQAWEWVDVFGVEMRVHVQKTND